MERKSICYRSIRSPYCAYFSNPPPAPISSRAICLTPHTDWFPGTPPTWSVFPHRSNFSLLPFRVGPDDVSLSNLPLQFPLVYRIEIRFWGGAVEFTWGGAVVYVQPYAPASHPCPRGDQATGLS
ncbi:hypothetical protein AVEN_263340-1 [Araneus ventricosus]|uniref:Uncharacterized protein n=1 Tax=Araneus ventricosus TaxID=182803 RepID=A0A4Y2D378_ARAVE|nr:hypothetical protein AVEN_263340-1 [Araneus ventricosus]